MTRKPLLACLALATLLSACDCGKKSESSSSSSSSSSPEPEKLPPPVRVGGDGGTVERGKAKLEFPKGALEREQDIHFDEVRTGRVISYKPAGPAFRFTAEQATFAAPVKATLPLDVSKLPAGVKPEHVYVVLAFAGMGEALDEPPPKVDLDAGTVTVLLARSFTLASGDAAGSGAGPVLQAAVNPGGIDSLEVTPRVDWCAAHGLQRSAEMMEKGKAIMKLVRENYDPLGLANLGQIKITFKSMNPNWGGVTTGPNAFEINSDTFLSRSPKAQGATFMHEYFHLHQLKSLQRNLQGLKVQPPSDFQTRGQTSWFLEATATWMQENLSGQGAEDNLGRLHADFCYQPLWTHDETDSPHQYAAYIFISWLDTQYSARTLVVQAWKQLCSGSWLRKDLDDDAGRCRGSFNTLDVLDHLLQETPDKQGRKRTLREVYAEFLLHFCWLKDFAPLKGGALTSVLGPPRELVLPKDKTTEWTIPFDENGKRLAKKSETVTGEAYHIVRAFKITCALDKGKGEKGDLEVSLRASAQSAPNESMIVVFPVKKGPEDPEIGNAATPVKIRNWQECTAAIVWVVDLSILGEPNLTVTAQIKEAGDMAFVLTAQVPREPFTENMTTANFTLSFAPPDGVDVKTPEGKKQFEALADKWDKALMDEKGENDQWIHVTATVDGRAQHFYGRIGNCNAPGLSIFSGKLLLPRKPGTFRVEAKSNFRGQPLAVAWPVTMKLRDGREAYARDGVAKQLKEIEELKAGKRENYFLARAYSTIGTLQASVWHDKEAIEAWNTGLRFTKDNGKDNGEEPGLVEAIARNAFERGDVTAFLEGMEKAKQPVSYQECAEWVLSQENNPKKAKELKRKVPDIKEEELERFRQWPNEGDKVFE